jgi:gamma-glutamyl-gamma-aminobutyrate hydrolase PuuD/uncharacterized protein YjbI with pentapeptide repeats
MYNLWRIFAGDFFLQGVEANWTIDRVAHKGDKLPRLLQVAVPFLAMYGPMRAVTTVCLGGMNIYVILNGEMGKVEAVKLAYLTASIAATLFKPEVGAVMGLAVGVGMDAKGIWDGEWKQGWELASNLVFAYSLYVRRTSWALAALAMHGASDLKRSWSEFREGRWIEVIGHLGLAAVRVYQAAPKVRHLKREWYGKRLTQDDLERIFSRVNRERLAGEGQHVVWGAGDGGLGIDFDQILAEGEFSSRVEGLSFAAAVEGRKQGWSRVIFSGMHFVDCDFGRTELAATVFHGCRFDNVDLSRCDMRQALLTYCGFFNCSLGGALLNSARLWRVRFFETRLRGTYFSNARMIRVSIENSELYRAVFLGAEVHESKLVGCDLEDVLLFDAAFAQEECTENVLTRPTVGISFKYGPGKFNTKEVERTLEDLGCLPVRIDAIPHDIDAEKLEGEVKALTAQAFWLRVPSVAAYVLENAPEGSEIARLRDRAAHAAAMVDALVIPGGLNMEQEFQFPGEQTNLGSERSFKKTITEFSLFRAAEALERRVLALCRGIQVFNVWRGGTLREVEGQMGVDQTLTLNPDLPAEIAERMGEMVGEEVAIVSMHKHAIDQIGQGLHVLFEHEGIVKGVVSEDGRIIALQPHPELHSDWQPTENDEKNHNFFRWLVNGALTDDIAYTPPGKVEKV